MRELGDVQIEDVTPEISVGVWGSLALLMGYLLVH